MSLSTSLITSKKVENLAVQVYKDRQSMGKDAAADVSAKMKELLQQKERIRMIFASAPSQNELLEALRMDTEIDWKRVTVFHMDEYIGLPPKHPQRFSQFLIEQLFDIVHPGVINLIESSNDEESECERYSQLLKEGQIDIVCLGIGENGHIAFNDPPVADFDDSKLVKPVQLDAVSRQQQVNDGCFLKLADVPTHALTLTIPALMSGKHLFCIVPGATKSAAVKRVLTEPVSTEIPASILRNHPNCTLYLDRDSYHE